MKLVIPHKNMAKHLAEENKERVAQNLNDLDIIEPGLPIIDELNEAIIDERSRDGVSSEMLMDVMDSLIDTDNNPDYREGLQVVTTYLGEVPEYFNIKHISNTEKGLELRVVINED